MIGLAALIPIVLPLIREAEKLFEKGYDRKKWVAKRLRTHDIHTGMSADFEGELIDRLVADEKEAEGKKTEPVSTEGLRTPDWRRVTIGLGYATIPKAGPTADEPEKHIPTWCKFHLKLPIPSGSKFDPKELRISSDDPSSLALSAVQLGADQLLSGSAPITTSPLVLDMGLQTLGPDEEITVTVLNYDGGSDHTCCISIDGLLSVPAPP